MSAKPNIDDGMILNYLNPIEMMKHLKEIVREKKTLMNIGLFFSSQILQMNRLRYCDSV